MRTRCRNVASGGHLPPATLPRPLTIGYWSLITDHWSLLALSLLLLTLGAGCHLVKTATNMPGQAVRAVTPGRQNKDIVDPVDVQQKLLRFADDFSASMTVCVDKLQRGTNALNRAEVLQ